MQGEQVDWQAIATMMTVIKRHLLDQHSLGVVVSRGPLKVSGGNNVCRLYSTAGHAECLHRALRACNYETVTANLLQRITPHDRRCFSCRESTRVH